MSIIGWIIFGGVAGWLASLLMGTDKEQGLFGNIFAGIVGAIIGGFLFSMLGGAGVTGFNWYSLFVSVVGAVIFIWLIKLFRN